MRTRKVAQGSAKDAREWPTPVSSKTAAAAGVGKGGVIFRSETVHEGAAPLEWEKQQRHLLSLSFLFPPVLQQPELRFGCFLSPHPFRESILCEWSLVAPCNIQVPGLILTDRCSWRRRLPSHRHEPVKICHVDMTIVLFQFWKWRRSNFETRCGLPVSPPTHLSTKALMYWPQTTNPVSAIYSHMDDDCHSLHPHLLAQLLRQHCLGY